MTTTLDSRQLRRGNIATNAIRRHPLSAFFILATATSWIVWLPYIMSSHGLGLWDIYFPEVLGSAQITGVLPGAYLGPLGAAFLVTALTGGRAGLRVWGARLWRWRIGWYWYVGVLVIVPVALIASSAAFSGGSIAAPSMLALLAYLPSLVLQMLTTGLAEEPGWRDFALTHLQRRFSPLRASFILGPLWGVWHLPLFLSDWGGWPNADWTRPVIFMIFCTTFTIVVTWVFNRTRESLPIVMILHVGINNTASVLLPDMFPTLNVEASLLASMSAATIAAVVLVIVTRGRLGLPSKRGLVESGHDLR